MNLTDQKEKEMRERERSTLPLLCAIVTLICLCFILPVRVSADENTASVEVSAYSKEFTLDGAKFYSEDGQEEISFTVSGETGSLNVSPGVYQYAMGDGSTGWFEAEAGENSLVLARVDFSKAVNQRSFDGNTRLFDQDGREFGHAATEDEEDEKRFQYTVPMREGNAYYTYLFTPFDENYESVEGLFYVYRNTNFGALNLSDSGTFPKVPKKTVTAKVPEGMELLTTYQLKLYMQRNWQSYEPYKTEGGYDYYEVPASGYTYMLRQEGKVTRYSTSLIGTWNEDGTEVTVAELTDDPNQVCRDDEGVYSSMLTNLPYSSEIELEVGEYFDLVGLRGTQAIENNATNDYSDPEWHYAVVGGDTSVVSVEITPEDEIGQYGRIRANGEGMALVAFWYDAMETRAESGNDENGLHLFGALYPELTGIAVVRVGGADPQTEITTNIDMLEGRAVYFQKSQTDARGVKWDIDDHAEYTFTPKAETNGAETAVTSVRVHEPIMAEGGELSANPSDWLTDGDWTTYAANEDGSYTLELREGRSIVEIQAGDATVYHVILALGLDVTIENVYSPNQTLTAGDTAGIEINGLIPPMFKMGAIYNPSGVTYACQANGKEFTTGFGQYMASARFELKLTEEDAGTYTISNGTLSVAAWGAANESHRGLTRNSMAGYWSGGDNPNIDYGVMAYMPEITFEVEEAEDTEEQNARAAGLLRGLYVYSNETDGEPARNYTQVEWATEKEALARNGSTMFTPGILKNYIVTGAVLENENNEAKLLVRYWYGNDEASAVIVEREFSEFLKDYYYSEFEKKYYDNMTAFQLVEAASLTRNNPSLNIEFIVQPENGYPQTYSRIVYHAQGTNAITPILGDLQIAAAEGSEALGRYDGILEADDLTVQTDDGEETVDLGCGFIGTESHFTTSVPYGTEEIVLSAEATQSNFGNTIEVQVNGGSGTYGAGDAIPLKEGENELTVLYQPSKGKTRTYTIDVTRRNAPTKVTFEIPEGASAAVLQNGKTVKAEEDGTWLLKDGTYTYYVHQMGYQNESGTLEIDGQESEKTVTVDALTKLASQTGTVTVQIAGQSVVVTPTMDVDAFFDPDDADLMELLDLAARGYVQYNQGGYTALHALIDACELGQSEVGFSCYKGVLTPEVAVETGGLGANAGWVCEINGVVCEDYANTPVKDGDSIVFYYNSDREGMMHVWFEPETMTVKKGESAALTLMGTPVRNDGTAAGAVSGADVYLGSRFIGTTDGDGTVVIPGEAFPYLGEYRVTAVKNNSEGRNTLTASLAAVAVEKAADPDADPDVTSVTFRLIGDNKHGDGTDGHEYTTWLATQTYTFDKSEYEIVTAADVFRAALDEAGLEYVGLENNYIETITAPPACGGESLSEFDNGINSGWMYTVNGYHPSVGLLACEVTTGDEIIFHYIDDYETEVSDWSGGTKGNASTWDKWLEAEDETPGARDNAALVEEMIDAIGEVTLDSRETIEAARAAYNALSREEKSYVANYLTLTDAESRLQELLQEQADRNAAAAVTDQITDLPAAEDLTLEDSGAVEAARSAYAALTEAQKTYVTDDTLRILTDAEARIAQLRAEEAAKLVEEEIQSLPALEDLTLEDAAAVGSASAHYEALTEEQKALVTAESVEKLQAAEAKIAELQAIAADQEAARKVEEQIRALPAPEEIVFAQKPVVEAARAAYESLSDAQKAYVTEESLEILQALEQTLAALQAQVDAVQTLIEQLPDTGELTLEDRGAVEAAKEAYDALSLDQKQQLPEGLSAKLLASQNRLTELEKDTEAAEEVIRQINLLPNTDALTVQDETSVSAARTAYENLSDAQKALVPEEILSALAEKEARIEELKAQEPTPTPTPGETEDVTLTDQDYPVSVTGKNLSGYELRVEPLSADDSDVKLMKRQLGSGDTLIMSYDVRLYKDGTEAQPEGEITLKFGVDAKYNGKTLKILHATDGKVETLTGTVTDGVLSIKTDTLGKFSVAAASAGGTGGNGSTGSGSTGNKNTGSGSGSAAGAAPTGDSGSAQTYVLVLAIAVCAGTALAVYRRRRSAR